MRLLVSLLFILQFNQSSADGPSSPQIIKKGYHSDDGYNLRYIYEIFNEEQRDKLLRIPNRELIDYEKVSFKSQTGQVSPIVYLIKYSKNKGFIGYCSAALISSKVVLTAKHCMAGAELGLTLVVDDSYLQGKKSFQSSQVLRVQDQCSEIGWCKSGNTLDIPWKFKDYKSRDFSGEDVVLLHLESDMQSKDGFFKIHNPTTHDLNKTKLSIAGLPSFAVDLTDSYDNKYISKPVCDFVSTIGTSLIINCVPGSGVSGGPIFYTENGVYYLVGIVSSAIGPVFTGPDRIEFFGGTRAAAVFEIDFIKNIASP